MPNPKYLFRQANIDLFPIKILFILAKECTVFFGFFIVNESGAACSKLRFHLQPLFIAQTVYFLEALKYAHPKAA